MLTALALVVDPDKPQQKETAGQADEAVDEHADGGANRLRRQLGSHCGAGMERREGGGGLMGRRRA